MRSSRSNWISEEARLCGPGLAHAQPTKGSRCGANLVAKSHEFIASYFQLLAPSLCPLLRDRLQTTVSAGDARGGGFRKSGAGEVLF